MTHSVCIVPLSLQPSRCVYTACTLWAGLGGREQGGPSVHTQPVVLPFLVVEDVIDWRLCPASRGRCGFGVGLGNLGLAGNVSGCEDLGLSVLLACVRSLSVVQVPY